MTFLFTDRLPDFFQLVGAVFRFFPYRLADKNGSLGLAGQDDAIAGPCIDLNDLRMHFVLGLKNDPGEISIFVQRIDHDAFHLDVEGGENMADQFVRKGAFVMFAAGIAMTMARPTLGSTEMTKLFSSLPIKTARVC